MYHDKKVFGDEKRGTAHSYEEAYAEGYAAKYEGWLDRSNPYAEGTDENRGFDDGYGEAVIFAC